MILYDRDEIIPRILAEVASGRAVDRVLRDDEGMPHPATFWRWHMDDEALRDNLARARLNGVEVHMDEALDIANTPERGVKITTKADGTVETVEADMIEHRRLKIETRFKRAQMLAPRKYGPKVDVTSNGEALATNALTEDDRAARIAALIVTVQARLPAPGGEG